MDRLDVLSDLLKKSTLSTQDELRKKLEKMQFRVTQSTISRDLRKIGAMKALDTEGRTVYRLPVHEGMATETPANRSMVKNIQANASLAVVQTAPGTASLVALHLDIRKPAGILGTIAGDDTVFVALSPKRTTAESIRAIEESLKAI